MNRIEEIQARLAEINTLIDNASDEEVTALETESRALVEELEGLRDSAQARQALRDMVARGAGVQMPGFIPPAQASEEERAAVEFRQTRSMTIDAEQSRALLVSSGTLAQPTNVDGIHDIPGAKVSSIIDLVKVVNCVGMGTHRVAYVDADAAAATEQVEGAAAATAALGSFKFVDIKPESIAVLDFISKQAKKQTNLQYASKVREQAVIALRRAAAKIVTDALAASALNTAKTGPAIDDKTLRSIALSYGGDESVIGGAVLFLNKEDLLDFGDVRGTNEKMAVYEITPDSNGNTGVIRDGGLSVRYCIDSNVTKGTMFYGNPHTLELDLFSDYEVKISEDFAFDKLMDTIRGDVELGADVVVKGGFVKYTVGA